MAVRICVNLLLSSLLAGQVFADEAGDWLERMSSSFRNLTYQGTLTYQQGNQLQSLRIAHTVIDGKEFERLDYLDGKPREVIRRNGSLCINPGHKLVQLFSPASSSAGNDHARQDISRYYAIKLGAEGRVAGHKVVNLTVTPRDTHRYGYDLSLDKDSGLLVRSELIGSSGKVLERFQFVQLNVGGTIPKDHFRESGNDHPLEEIPETSDDAGAGALAADWKVGWLPPGFFRTATHVDNNARDMMTFTDGLAVFSVFFDADNAAHTSVMEGGTHKGATSAYFKYLNLGGRSHRVTVVGEIPQQTAREIARSVTLASGH